MNAHPEAETLIRELGGLAPVSRLFNIKLPSVADWRSNGVPHARLQTLQAWARLPANAALPTAEITPARVRKALEAAGLSASKSRAA